MRQRGRTGPHLASWRGRPGTSSQVSARRTARRTHSSLVPGPRTPAAPGRRQEAPRRETQGTLPPSVPRLARSPAGAALCPSVRRAGLRDPQAPGLPPSPGASPPPARPAARSRGARRLSLRVRPAPPKTLPGRDRTGHSGGGAGRSGGRGRGGGEGGRGRGKSGRRGERRRGTAQNSPSAPRGRAAAAPAPRTAPTEGTRGPGPHSPGWAFRPGGTSVRPSVRRPDPGREDRRSEAGAGGDPRVAPGPGQLRTGRAPGAPPPSPWSPRAPGPAPGCITRPGRAQFRQELPEWPRAL